MADAHKNFAISTVVTAPSPATSGTSLVSGAGEGALFPTPPFNMVVWPTAVAPTAANAEVVRVTGISTDTFTIDREEEGTTARTIVVGDQIAANITAKTFTDIETALVDHIADTVAAHAATAISNTPAGSIAATTVQAAIDELEAEKQPLDSDLTTIAGLTATTDNFLVAVASAWSSRTPAQVAATLQAEIGKLMYPIGCIYTSINSTNPATSLGFGTWSAFGAGRVPVGFDSGQTEFDTDEETGGAKTTTISHTHTIDHTHTAADNTNGGAYNTIGSRTFSGNSGAMSANSTPSILQPYIVVRMWKRTA